MANKFRGEAPLQYTRDGEEGEETVNTKLVFDANALCEVERITGLTMGGFLEQLSDTKKMSFTMVRAFVYAGLLRANPDFTIMDAGDVISDAGLDVVTTAMQTAVEGAMPKAKAGKGAKAKAGN